MRYTIDIRQLRYYEKCMTLNQILANGTVKNRSRIKNTMRIFCGEWREVDQRHRLFVKVIGERQYTSW